MKGIKTPGQALDPGGFASFSAQRGGVFHLAFPALARDWKHQDTSTPLASLGNQTRIQIHFYSAGENHGSTLARGFCLEQSLVRFIIQFFKPVRPDSLVDKSDTYRNLE